LWRIGRGGGNASLPDITGNITDINEQYQMVIQTGNAVMQNMPRAHVTRACVFAYVRACAHGRRVITIITSLPHEVCIYKEKRIPGMFPVMSGNADYKRGKYHVL
jgi:hypothetical protein